MGAVFSGGGAVVSYDDGVQAAASGTTGTQRNEFTAAIKSVTSATTVGAVFLYDTSADSDGGAWRKKCKGLSWFDEASSATRSARSEFPAMALIVADNAASATVTIYDLDDPAMPMWMVFNVSNTTWLKHYASSAEVSSVTMLNGRLITGGGGNGRRLSIVSFPDDNGNASEPGYNYEHFGIINRQSPVGAATGPISIVDIVVNDVAATWLEGGELDSMGLVRPVIACATDGGVSVIHPSGDVYDIAEDGTANNPDGISFDENNNIITAWNTITSGTRYTYAHKIPFADEGADDSPLIVFGDSSTTTNVDLHYSNGGERVQNVVGISGGHAMGRTAGLTLHKYNQGNPAEGAVAYITSAYNTGYMVGDIRGAWITNGSSASDRSVKSNSLTQPVSSNLPAQAAVATGAELLCQAGFSASNYLERAHHTDFDFGTGDFSVIVWVKVTSADGYLVMRDTAAGSSNKFGIYIGGSSFTVYAGTETDASALDVDDGSWHQIGLVRTGGELYTLEDGKYGASSTTSASTVTNGEAVLNVGRSPSSTNAATNASISLLRISKTAPTPSQIKAIFESEKPLFQAGAKCLLDENPVNDLAYDKTSGLLHVASETTDDGKTFRGLEAVGSLTSDGTFGLGANKPMDYLSASGGVVAGVGGETAGSDDTSGVGVNLPAIDVRAELNEGESKIPDDGKLHFEASIYGATQTTIGHIPLAENETINLVARIRGCEYNETDSSNEIQCEIKRGFRRAIGGNVGEKSETYKLTHENNALLDVDLDDEITPQTAAIKVTGLADTQMVWTASVEVQRISDKTYER